MSTDPSACPVAGQAQHYKLAQVLRGPAHNCRCGSLLPPGQVTAKPSDRLIPLTCRSLPADDVGCSFDASPKKERLGQLHPGSALSGSSAIDRVREMQQSDREPSDGRLLVVLPLHADGGSQQAQQAQRAKQQFALLAAVFRNEPRLAFRLAPVSGTLLSLLDDGSSSCGNSSAGSEVGQQPGQQGQQQQLGPLAQAIILHPQLAGRFQLLRLPGVRQAVARLEEVLDGGGHWHQGR